ncbi:hypothetical protein GCM10027271_11690 [Saccharopolyspora gloriosae]
MFQFASALRGKSFKFRVTITCARFDRRGQYVPVVGVGQGNRFDQRLVTCDQAVPDGSEHQLARALELARIEFRTIAPQVAERLVQDLIGPLGLHQSCLSQPDQQVAQCARVQHVGVVDDDERHCQSSPISWVSSVSSSAAERRF